ncbi:LuxR C-terminal-related transcriptional regulator [Rhodococcus sp. TAF43]|uniref:LuxR C-terminal-related transcriptional regulator n=1 Tax=Rhodococcus sp. TAF43 TaxID=3237483 RepID=UPI003F97B50A
MSARERIRAVADRGYCRRRWIDRALPQPGSPPTERAEAIYVACGLAVFQSDLAAATDLVEEGRILDTGESDPMVHAFVAAADGWAALAGGDLDRARTYLEDAVDTFGKNHALSEWVSALVILGWTYQSSGQTSRARVNYEQALSITESHGESMHRSYALWSMGIVVWLEGDRDRAAHHLEQGLQLVRLSDDPLMPSAILQAMAWVSDDREPRRAAVMMGAADALYLAVDRASILFPNVLVYGEQSERNLRRELGARAFEAAYREGRSLDFEAAIAFALGERSNKRTAAARAPTDLTKREHQVAELVAEGLTNKAIAARLVLSRRTVDGHVAHVLTKLGFTSRAQIAAWVVEQEHASGTTADL